MNSPTPILVTGAAGFIGFHLCNRLAKDHHVLGLDNLNSYYDVSLKKDRLEILNKKKRFSFVKADITDKATIDRLFKKYRFKTVINLAAQAGVNHSITHPYDYVNINITGFLNILEACRYYMPEHLIYASSSSVYGANRKMPFSASDGVDHPLALYAVSKKSNELMAHAYANLYDVPSTGLRFFSAYGTYGRPDMAMFIFTKAVLSGRPINIYNYGQMRRDFTYIDDIVEGIVRLMPLPPRANKAWDATVPDPATSFAPYKIFNVGNNAPVDLLEFIQVLEEKLGKKAVKNFLPMQDGDVEEARAETADLEEAIDFKPSTTIREGVGKFVEWYKKYYKIK